MSLQRAASPLRLLLVGGGHAHLAVLTMFARFPRNDVEVTLISAEAAAFYSGMVPGVIAGHYAAEEAQVPLAPLAATARGMFLHDEVTALDFSRKQAHRRAGSPLSFDFLSLDIGSTPTHAGITCEDGAVVLPVKPVETLLAGWRDVQTRAARGEALSIATIGGGLGGIELTLAMAHRLRDAAVTFHLLTRDETIAPAAPPQAREFLLAALGGKRIRVHTAFAVDRIAPRAVVAADGRAVSADFAFLAAHGAAAPWLAASGLAVDESGFLAVDEKLRSLSHPFVFAAGDAAAFMPRRLPKSGVVAVRQGETLAHNLWALIDGAPLAAYRPQNDWLALVGTGGAHAVAMRGAFAAQGKIFWRLKQSIDRRFVARHRR